MISNKKGEFMEKGDAEDKRLLHKFNEAITKEYEDMISFTANSKLILNKKTLNDVNPTLRMRQKIFQQRMAMMCLSPLGNGVDAENLLTSGSMFLGMYLASPVIRKDIKGAINKYKADKIEKKIDKLVQKGVPESNWKLKHFVKKRNKYVEKSVDGEHVPYTAESAALFGLGLKKQCYDRMRNMGPEDNIDDIIQDYNDAMDALYEIARHDGVDKNDIKYMEGFIYGRMVNADPSFKDYFEDMSYGDIKMSEPVEQRFAYKDENGVAHMRTEKVWNGTFVDANGNTVTPEFIPRAPMDKGYIRNQARHLAGAHINASNLIKNKEKRENEKCNVELAMDRAFGNHGYIDKDKAPGGPHGESFLSSEVTNVLIDEYESLIKAAELDGVKPDSIRADMALGRNEAQINNASKEFYQKYRGSGMVMSKVAIEYAKETFGIVESKELEAKGKEFSMTSILAMQEDGIGPKREKYNSDEEYANAVQERAKDMADLIKVYQHSFRNSVMMGNSIEKTQVALDVAEEEVASQWAGIDASRRSKIDEAEAYAKVVTQNWIDKDMNSDFMQAAMNSARKMHDMASKYWKDEKNEEEPKRKKYEGFVHINNERDDDDIELG